MRFTIAIRVLAALLLIGAGYWARIEAREARVEAGVWEQLATLRLGELSSATMPAATPLARVTGEASHTTSLQATVEYWLGQHDELVAERGGDVDPDVLFVAANAAFRAARRDRRLGPEAARQLDGVLRAYANVLKAAPHHRDAAYNLEYVARLQNQIAGARAVALTRGGREEPRGAGRVQTTDVPAGPTIHGSPGSEPPTMKEDEFHVLTPRGTEQQEADPGQLPGGKVQRKG
ncbi:MAG: hypothetical protein IT178_16300 [Acidobacteria bacterium]|nr:hypothetical protein [Acidobacteriota bacterium]